MIGQGEEELICDFAETYHIYDYKSLPASRAAILASGLRADSRIKTKMRCEKLTLTQTLIATMIDPFAQVVYARFGQGEAPSIVSQLNGTQPKETAMTQDARQIRTFASAKAFDEEIKRLRGES